MHTILVTGSKGQLGNEIQIIAKRYQQFNFIFTDVDELDITNPTELKQFFSENKIDFVVNCAAYTAVDKAEDDQELCFKINEHAVKLLGEAAVRSGAKIIHISTDYVFDGTGYLPYTEDMSVCPVSVYGKSKLAGEMALLTVCPDALIIRTSWLYSSFGNNFVKTMLKLGKERDTLQVVADQVGTPTYAGDLADAIMKIISADQFTSGIYHYSNEGVCSWYDFTKAIHRIAGINCNVMPIDSKAYPVKAPRPHYSVLNKQKIKTSYQIAIPYWEESLVRCISILFVL